MKSRTMLSDHEADGVQEPLSENPASVPLLGHHGPDVTIRPHQDNTKEKIPSKFSEDLSQPDVIVAAIGNFGRWQMLMTFLLALFSFPCTFHIYLPTFTGMKTNFWCKAPDNLSDLPAEVWINYSQPQGPCEVRDLPADITVASILSHTAQVLPTLHKCSAWSFDRSEVGDTIISEWNLVCDKDYLNNLAEMLFLVGIGIGGAVGGFISDKFGRKRILMSMIIAQSVLSIFSVLVKTYLQYAILRLVMGLVSVSVVFAAFVLTVELVGGKWVTIAGVCVFFPLPLSYIIVTVVSLAVPNWRKLQLSLSLFGWALIPLWFVLPESPRWLISVGRLQETKAILERAAKFNNKELPADIDKLLHVNNTENEPIKPTVSMLFKEPLLQRTCCLFITWFSMTIGYYGLVLNIGNFNIGNLHTTSIILALVEIPAIALSIPILLKAGRRIPVFISMLVCGLACIATELFTITYNNTWVLITCLIIGKFAIGATNMMLPIYTAELYPTIIRNLGVGGSQVSAGLALACVPYLWNLVALNVHLPMVTLAVLCIVGGAVILILPDTRNTTMQDTSEKYAQTTLATDKSLSLQNGAVTIVNDRGQQSTK